VIDSELGKGTAITLLLPRSAQPMASGSDDALPVDGPASAPDRCVLLVEDDAEVATLVEEMLRVIGYDVVRAKSAQAALGALADERRIDLVFSDIMMPGGTNGIELAKEIRRRRADLPVLLTSGYAESTGNEAHALDIPVLRKPYAIEDLRVAVRQQLAAASHGA